MYPIVRVEKRIPDGSIWQRYRGYRLPDVRGANRVFVQGGTTWWNGLGGWTTPVGGHGISLFLPDRPFVITCHGQPAAKRFYIDIVRSSTVIGDRIVYVDLYLDVMIDPAGTVTEKDEEQLDVLEVPERDAVRRARDAVRSAIDVRNPLFDARSDYFAVPERALTLGPLAAD